jgi:hypothetical protein
MDLFISNNNYETICLNKKLDIKEAIKYIEPIFDHFTYYNSISFFTPIIGQNPKKLPKNIFKKFKCKLQTKHREKYFMEIIDSITCYYCSDYYDNKTKKYRIVKNGILMNSGTPFGDDQDLLLLVKLKINYWMYIEIKALISGFSPWGCSTSKFYIHENINVIINYAISVNDRVKLQILLLKQIIYKKLDVNKNTHCPISMDEIKETSKYMTCNMCKYQFLSKNIKKWLNINMHCPLCKSIWTNLNTYQQKN